MLGLVSDDAETRRAWDRKFLPMYYGGATRTGGWEEGVAKFFESVGRALQSPDFPRDEFVRRLVRFMLEDHTRYHTELKSPSRGDELPATPLLSPSILLRHLAAYAQPALPEILQLLARQNDDSLAGLGCELLTQPGTWALPAVEPVLSLAKSSRAFSHPNRVAAALVALEPLAPFILDRLIEQLSDADSHHRQAAAIILRHFGAKAGSAVSTLLAKLEDPDGDVRSCAAGTLAVIGTGKPEVIAALFRLVHDPEWYVRGSALSALSKLNAPREQMIPLLIEALKEDFGTPDWSVPDVAVDALAKYGPSARAAIPELRRLLERLGDEKGDNTFTLPQRTVKALATISVNTTDA